MRQKFRIDYSKWGIMFVKEVFTHGSTLRLVEKFANLNFFSLESGSEGYLSELKKRTVNQSEIQFFFYPPVPNEKLPDFYAGADVSVWPDWLSIGTFEAQSCGLPLIVSDCSPIMEERVQWGNGLIYRRGNVEDLAGKMHELAIDNELRNEMSRKGRTVIEKELNWDVIGKKFIELVNN